MLFVGNPRALAFAAAALALPACGAKTGLRVGDAEAATFVDATAPADAGLACRPLRVRTRVGMVTSLRIEVEGAPARDAGYAWSIVTAPPRARAMVFSTGNALATLSPDVEGTYELAVATPFATSDGGTLVCPATVVADPADPLCPNEALVEPQVVQLPNDDAQFAFEAGWSTPRVNPGSPGGASLVATDMPADDVAAFVADLPTGQDLETFATGIEARVAAAVDASPVLIGREGATPDGLRVRRSSFRVTARLDTSADVVRDRVAREVTGLAPGAPAPGFGIARDFTLEVTTLVRPVANRGVVIFAVAPERLFDDPARNTAVRLADVTNATGFAVRGRELDVVCQLTPATRTAAADFLWLVDTSGSMSDDQERLGNTASRFFREMTAAGIDFRVGVVQAGAMGPVRLDSPGFEWISGSAPDGPRRLAYEVTYRRFRNEMADNLSPYPLLGQGEEPLGAAVLTATEMERRMGEPGARRSFRPDVTRVAFFVTDESGTRNDDERFLARDRARWGATPEARVTAAARWFRDHQFLTFGLVNVFPGGNCPRVDNLIPCVVTANGGAYIPIATALDAEVGAALSRIVDSIAGSGSEFTLNRTPVSSTLRVRVDARTVPRSRADGFDYSDTGRAIVFRGATYRPRRGQEVRSAFFYWR